MIKNPAQENPINSCSDLAFVNCLSHLSIPGSLIQVKRTDVGDDK